jgi:hypothetical protein
MRSNLKSFLHAVPKNAKESQDSYARQHDAWRRAYAQAELLRARFPEVAHLSVELTFEDPHSAGHYSSQMRGFGPAAQALLAFACPRTLCLGGGFDLDPEAVEMIAHEKSDASGTLVCGGHLRPKEGSHAPTSPCGLRLHYRLVAAYEATATEVEPVRERNPKPAAATKSKGAAAKPATRARR